MIATFPDFSDLDVSHKTEVEKITAQFEPYSDFNFASLFAWDIDRSARIALLDGNLIVSMPDYLTSDVVYSLIGGNALETSVLRVLELTPELHFVPEAVIQKLGSPASLAVRETPEHFDYIFAVEQLATLSGQQHRSKRKNIHRFTRAYQDRYAVDGLDLTRPDVQSDIKSTVRKWAKERGKPDSDVINEQTAIGRLVDNAASFNLICSGLTLDGEMAGFSIHEILEDGMSICHFQKTVLSYVGIDPFLTREAAKELLNHGVSYVNWEQDLGLPGLHELKSSYQPAKLFRKYAVRQSPAQ